MFSSDHKAEAERLLHLARTDEGKQADDPADPLVVLQLAQTHALLAAVPDDVIDAEVVDEEAEQLVAEARASAEDVTGPWPALVRRLAEALEERSGRTRPVLLDADLDLLADAPDLALTATLQARTLWTAAQWGNLMLIARDTREAIVLTKTQLLELRSILGQATTTSESRKAVIEGAAARVDEWLEGFEG